MVRDRITEREAFDIYDEWLDENYAHYNIGHLEFQPSEILKTLDPVAYREGCWDFIDTEGFELKYE